MLRRLLKGAMPLANASLRVRTRLQQQDLLFVKAKQHSTLASSSSSFSSSSSTANNSRVVSAVGQVVEDDSVQLTGDGVLLPVTHVLEVVDTANAMAKWPVYRILGKNGRVLDGASDPDLSQDVVVNMYKTMVRVQALDDIFYNAQRQGRISFYMQNSGEEAIHIGSAAALTLDDVIFAQYREVGVLLWRGFTLQQAADQCFSNESDLGKGRQMPVHYGSAELNFQTISSPLSTQLPQAAGAAYALKLSKKPAVAMCYFGEGAASEGDFHAALNFASTLEAPVIFFARNNGYAISTPAKDQFRGDGIVSRAVGYGMHGIRVDGNDILAVYQATQAARAIAIEKSCPVLVEAMSYRRGHHSTSDDSTRYRSASEIKHWHDHLDPVVRFRAYLEFKNWWNADMEQELRDTERYNVLKALEEAEKKDKPHFDELFHDVYKETPLHLQKQKESLLLHMSKYPEVYENKGH